MGPGRRVVVVGGGFVGQGFARGLPKTEMNMYMCVHFIFPHQSTHFAVLTTTIKLSRSKI